MSAQVGNYTIVALFQVVVNVKPTLATTREKRTIGTINYA